MKKQNKLKEVKRVKKIDYIDEEIPKKDKDSIDIILKPKLLTVKVYANS